jgi:hypothetical protein
MLQISANTNKRHLYRAPHLCKKEQSKLIDTNRINRIRCAIKAQRFIDTCAVFFGKKTDVISTLFLPSLVAGASQQLPVFVLSHLFLAFFDDTSHCITSVL